MADFPPPPTPHFEGWKIKEGTLALIGAAMMNVGVKLLAAVFASLALSTQGIDIHWMAIAVVGICLGILGD